MYAPVKMKRTFFDKPHRERHLRFIIKMAKITHMFLIEVHTKNAFETFY